MDTAGPGAVLEKIIQERDMRLINDEYNDCWVWVEDHNEDLELSPHFDYEEDAIQWRDQMKTELFNAKNS